MSTTREQTSRHRRVWLDHYLVIPKGYHIHHIDGGLENNNILNLECLTPAEHGKRHRGRKPIGRILGRHKALEIIALLEIDNMSQKAIADQYGTTRQAVSLIKRGKTYKNLVRQYNTAPYQ